MEAWRISPLYLFLPLKSKSFARLLRGPFSQVHARPFQHTDSGLFILQKSSYF